QDFTLDVEMRRVSGKFGGFCFRGGFDLFLDDQNRLFLRKDYQVVQSSNEPLAVGGDGAFVHIRVVAAGGDLRVMINGVTQIELHDQPKATGGVGLLV